MATRRVVIRYPRHLIEAPLVSQMVRQYDLEFNILRASITPQSEGLMVLGLEGDDASIRKALDYASAQGLRIQPLERDVTRDEQRCTHCGACVTTCPSGALARDADTQRVSFSPDQCVACELCVPACPPRAMRVTF
jgi:ferredoxin